MKRNWDFKTKLPKSRLITKNRLTRTLLRKITLSFSSANLTKSWRIINAIRKIGILMQMASTS